MTWEMENWPPSPSGSGRGSNATGDGDDFLSSTEAVPFESAESNDGTSLLFSLLDFWHSHVITRANALIVKVPVIVMSAAVFANLTIQVCKRKGIFLRFPGQDATRILIPPFEASTDNLEHTRNR